MVVTIQNGQLILFIAEASVIRVSTITEGVIDMLVTTEVLFAADGTSSGRRKSRPERFDLLLQEAVAETNQ